MLTNTRIVLIETSHPGNIGAAARAMKTMGLSQLYLVAPAFFPHPKADEMAAGAKDILQKAIVVPTLDQAIGDCVWVIGTSARSRRVPWPLYQPREIAEKAKKESHTRPIAILFGREDSGLSNAELQRCHCHVQIPASIDYSALNLAAAVQVMAYEWHLASLSFVAVQDPESRLANSREMESFYQHLEQVLTERHFLKSESPRQLMARLRCLFQRARVDVREVNILRGILGLIEKQKETG